MKKQLTQVILLSGIFLSIPFYVQGASNTDTAYTVFDNSAQIILPAYWYTTDKNIKHLNGSTIESVFFKDQAEKLSRVTKSVIISRGKPSVMFSIPENLASKLQSDDLINIYVDNVLRNKIGVKSVSAKISEADGVKKYTIEYNYLSYNKINFTKTEIFIFKGDMVYRISGEYMTDRTVLKEKVAQVIQSFKFK